MFDPNAITVIADGYAKRLNEMCTYPSAMHTREPSIIVEWKEHRIQVFCSECSKSMPKTAKHTAEKWDDIAKKWDDRYSA